MGKLYLIITKLYMITHGRHQFNQSFIIKSLKPNIYKEYSKISNKSFVLKISHKNLQFSYTILIDLPLLYKDFQEVIYSFYSFLKEVCINQPFSLFKQVYLNSREVKFQMLIAR